MTRAYQSRVLKKSVSPMCRKCHRMPETTGHILSHCESHFWTLYKERHDQGLGVLYYHLCRKLGLKVFKPWKSIPAVQETDRARLMWDVSLSTDRALVHRRPDITLTLKESKTTLLLEMACCYDSLIEERQKEKQQKYEELVADLALQFPGNKVKSVPLVIGDLGSIGNQAKSLESTKLFTPKEWEAVLCSMQTRVLYSSTRILKRHLSG